MNKLEIVKALLSDEKTEMNTSSISMEGGSKIKIAVLQRGWVFIGKFSQEGSKCQLTNAYNIRTWGTTKGLGELAENGKTDSTKLDKVNDITFHELSIVVLIDVDDKKWSKEI